MEYYIPFPRFRFMDVASPLLIIIHRERGAIEFLSREKSEEFY